MHAKQDATNLGASSARHDDNRFEIRLQHARTHSASPKPMAI